MILTECVIAKGWVTTIVWLAGRLIVSYSGLVERRSPRSWASVVGGLGGDCALGETVSSLKFQLAPTNGSDVNLTVARHRDL